MKKAEILAVIPARMGSKRLPGKNRKLLKGKPLVSWSIEAAARVPEISSILVSTDDPEIARIAGAHGWNPPWLRPEELCTDTANSVDVALHAADWYRASKGQLDGILLLQPTSPFRSGATMSRGISIFLESGKPVVGFSPSEEHPYWCYFCSEDGIRKFVDQSAEESRSQDLPPAYMINGSFYLISPEDLKRYRTFIPPNTLPLISGDKAEAVDIDTEWDWKYAEWVAEVCGIAAD